MSVLGSVLGWFMSICYDLTKNYGLSIILFTLLTKVILFPISLLTQGNSIKMVRMKPEIAALKIKYVDDKDKFADEQLALYKKYHYIPLIDTIPLLIQIPLIIGLIYVVYHPLNYVLRMDGGVIDLLRQWIEGLVGTSIEENQYQLDILAKIHAAICPNTPSLSSAVDSIRGLSMQFCGLDLSITPSFNEHYEMLIIPLLSGLSAWFMCFVQNRINVLQMTQGKLEKNGMTIFMIAFSTYFSFLVPGSVGLYWIFGNLFAIIPMWLVNVVIPPKKYIDFEYLKKMEEQRIEKEKHYKVHHAREKADYKKFCQTEKKLVFYSESNGFYKYFKGFIDYVCEHSDIPIHYVTSDPDDKIFQDPREQIHAYYVGSNTLLISLFMKLECRLCVMTVPDLEKYHIKRSRVQKDVEYVFVCHGMGSAALTYRKGALDWFDTIFCPGVDNFNEIRDSEELYGTPKKRLVELGYPLIDEMIANYNATTHEKNKIPKILIAPSWQPDNIVDSCAETLLNQLRDKPYQVILRPHPQQVRHEPEKFEIMKQKFADAKNIEIQTDFSSNNPIMEADLLITDWSDISWEYAFVTLHPILFINTPMKIMNPEYDRIATKPINITLRSEIGRAIEPDAVSGAAEIIADMLNRADEYHDTIERVRGEHLYNIGKSAKLGGRYIIKSVEGAL